MKSAVPIDLESARRALASEGERAADLVASIPDPTAPVPGLDWTVGQAAAHLVVVLSAFTGAARGVSQWGPLIPGSASGRGRVAAVNAASIDLIAHDDAAYLAGQLGEAQAQFLAATERLPADHALPMPWYGDEATLPLDAATALLVGEQLVHGRDIAGALGRPWAIDAGPARLVIAAITAMLPGYLDADEAASLRAIYEIRIRGGPRFSVSVAGREASVDTTAPGPVDCRISADPVAFVLVAYGRTRLWPAIASGKLLAWGRRPWLGFRFSRLFQKP